MNKLELQRLVKLEERIYQIAEEEGLKFVPIEFDIVPENKMLEIMAYGMPGQISNWKFGRDYERLKTIYEHSLGGLPMEVVITTNPARSYLMKNNTFAVQALVVAHVVGHVSFSTMNKYHDELDKDIVSKFIAASDRFNDYERKYGIEILERTVDAGHSIYLHSSPFETEETEDEKRQRIFKQMKQKAHERVSTEFDDLFVDNNEIAMEAEVERDLYNHNLWMKLKNQIPVEPTEDILRFVIDNSRVLSDWQKDILEILRYQGRYTWPHVKTKYMNEGFACIVPNSLVITENGFVKIEEAVQYCNKVVGIENKLVNIDKRCVTEEIPTVKIKTNIGLEIEGAELHRILVKVNNSKKDIHLKDLKIGDNVFIATGLNIWPNNLIKINIDSCLQRQQFSRTQKVNIPTKINKDIAYLLGSLVSEGTNLTRGFQFTNQNDVYLELIKSIIESTFNKKVEIEPRENSDTKDIKVHSTPIIDFLYQAGLNKGKSKDKEIPWSILQSPKNIVSHFIAGLFDGDGCIYYNGKYQRQLIFTSKSEKLIRQLVIVLLNYGIYGSFSINKKEGYEDCYQLKISKGKCLKIFYKEILFTDSKKIKLLKEAIDSLKWEYPLEDTCKIIGIEFGKSINYDWHIPDGNHYIAQGFINHNTYWHEFILRKLFNENLLTSEEHAEYNYTNALVKSKNPFSMNPYLIGSEMWYDLVDRYDKGRFGEAYEQEPDMKTRKEWDTKDMLGREKMFETLRTHNDWFFMQNFLTDELVRDLELYLYVKQKDPYSEKIVVTDKTKEEVRKLIIKSFAHSGIPKIVISDGRRKLYLEHRHVGMDLDPEYTQKTLAHIAYLWGDDVYLSTIQNKVTKSYKSENPYVPSSAPKVTSREQQS